MLGREIRTPAELAYGQSPNAPPVPAGPEYARQLKDRLDFAHAYARRQLNNAGTCCYIQCSAIPQFNKVLPPHAGESPGVPEGENQPVSLDTECQPAAALPEVSHGDCLQNSEEAAPDDHYQTSPRGRPRRKRKTLTRFKDFVRGDEDFNKRR